MSDKIIQKDVVDSYLENMIRYSISVNRRRAIPEVKDGLKPVQRRIFYDMIHDLRCLSESSKVKSSRIVGDVMGKYHPHGDSSIYGTLVPLANWWNTKYPICTSYSNFGTIEGESAAAMRYTEASVSQFGLDSLGVSYIREIPSIVDWSSTHDEKTVEPDYFPAIVPMVLINGTFGIGTGMKVYIPPHNIVEVINATLNLIDNPEAPVVLIPDFCEGCHIIDTNWKAICNSGNGKFYVRGNIDIGEHDGNPCLHITSLPDYVTGLSVKDKILKLVDAGQLPMVSNLLSASKNKTGLDIIVVLKKGSDPNYVREILYAKTECQTDFTVNFEVIDGIEPVRMSYRSYLIYFIEFAKFNKFRYYHNLLQKELTSYHELDAYIKVLQSGEVDNIIKMIRNQKDDDENILIEWLLKKLKITDLQAKFILRTQLQKLSKGNLGKYIEKANQINERIKLYDSFIKNDAKIIQAVKDDLIYIRDKYGDKRKCDVIKLAADANIPQGTFNIVITENNFIRKLEENKNINTVRGDLPNFALKVDNTENLLIFDTKGKVYKVPVFKVPLCDTQNPGLDLRLLIKGFTSDVSAVMYEPLVKQVAKTKIKHYITMVTENNYCKKMDLEDFINCPPSGIIYAKINPGDTVKSVEIVPDSLDVIVYSEHKALRFPMKDIPLYKRITVGVNAMATKDKVEGLSVVYPDADSVIVITRSGRINKFSLTGLNRSSRYKAGSSIIKLSKTDEIFSVYGVNDSNILKLVTSEGVQMVPIKDIPSGSSVSQGAKMITTKGNMIIKTEIH